MPVPEKLTPQAATPRIESTGGALGAYVRGIDLAQPLTPSQVGRLKAALLEHLLLFFPGQSLDESAQVRFTGYFGTPEVHVREQPERPVQEVFIVSNVERDGTPLGSLGHVEIPFHSDLSYLPRPGSYSVVHAVEIPGEGGDTQWANGFAAYEELEPQLKERLEGLRAVHRHPEAEQNVSFPVSHPMVRRHPETGRKLIYVSPHFTRHVEGLQPEESRRLLDELFRHLSQPRFVWTHKWVVGDLVIWDNCGTMHRRLAFDPGSRRILNRTQVFGDEPLA